MRTLKILSLAIVALLASAVMAASAIAVELPDLHIALGEAFPVTAEGEIKGSPAARLEDSLKEPLTATGVKIKLEATTLSSLGPLTLLFTGAKQKTSECTGEGEAKEVITAKGEWHLVDKVVAGKLTLIWLVLFSELKITCGKVKVTIKPPLLTQVTTVSDMVDTTTFGIQPKCVASGKQEITEYETDTGMVLTKQLLLTNLGLGNEIACLEFTTELVFKANKMVEFLF
jgi:hypothetical protein